MKVLVTDGIAPEGAQIILNAGFELVEQFYAPADLQNEIVKYDAIIVRSATKVPKEIIDAGTNLKAIARGGVGIDNIDFIYAKEKGIPVLNTPGASAISVAELAIAQMFALSRFLHVSTSAMKAGKWPKKEYSAGRELTGKTLGIIGFGAIAQEVAKRAIALGMNVIVNIRSSKSSDLNVKFVSKEELFAQSDIITLHIPLDKTVGATISKNEFAQMKDGVMLINTARGGVVNEQDLVEALNSGKVASAAIDVFLNEPPTEAQSELINHPNVCLTPHIGGSTEEGQLRVSTEIAQKVVDVLKSN
jgi:D-3-phosphoglycerate dehydrogenase